jgi:hypothetical protein
MKNAIRYDVAYVDLVRTGVSEERVTFVFGVERMRELGTTLAVTSRLRF